VGVAAVLEVYGGWCPSPHAALVAVEWKTALGAHSAHQSQASGFAGSLCSAWETSSLFTTNHIDLRQYHPSSDRPSSALSSPSIASFSQWPV